VPIKTAGDRRRGADKSRFVKEIEEALLGGDVDLAVHSAKDVPGVVPDGLAIVGAPPAEDARDALVGTARRPDHRAIRSLDELPEGARVGTSSLRRRSQLLAIRPDLDVAELHGNVDTRLRKQADGGYDAIVLALAGLRRLGREAAAGAIFDPETFLPAPGQGVLALEARANDPAVAAVVAKLGDETSLARLSAERALVEALDTSCHTPVGAYAQLQNGSLRIDGYVGLPDGREWIRDRVEGGSGDPAALARKLAERMLSAGAEELLRRAEAAARAS
jgi:hydroxymethylbilane synthase